MPRRVLGNDPFARGAAPRTHSHSESESANPTPVRRAPAPVAPIGETKTPAPKPIEPRKLRPVAITTFPRPVKPAALANPVPERPAAPPPVPPAFDTTVELEETFASQVRHLLEHQLPQFIENLARSSIEALGLTAQPVAVSDVDAFGRSEEFVARWQPVLARLIESYFRPEITGLERIPRDGPAILVSNHSGILPYDELLLAVALREKSRNGDTPGIGVRPLSEDFAINAPFAGSWLNRFGLVRASQDNAERLLKAGATVAAFPEGSQGIAKHYRDRYRLQRFGRGGFIRLALRTQVPIVPVALVGGEEAQPVFAHIRLPKPLKPSRLPLTPTFPWLGPLGLLPLPSRWHIAVGEPIRLTQGAEDANDRVLVAALSEEVRQTLQSQIDALLRERTSVFL